MIKITDVNNEQLKKLKQYTLKQETMEATAHPFYYADKRKIFKLFKDHINVDTKIKKIILLNDRLKDIDNVVTAETLIRHNGKIIGYTMPFIEGELFNCLTFNKKKNILVLKKVSEMLKELHNLNIVCGDIPLNVIVDKEGNPTLIDYDNFAIDDFQIDTKNILLQKYEKKVQNFDYHFDDYLMNLFTLNILTRILIIYLELNYKMNPQFFNFKDPEIRKIIENTFKLKDSYEEDLIIDKIVTKKDFKKIKRKLF